VSPENVYTDLSTPSPAHHSGSSSESAGINFHNGNVVFGTYLGGQTNDAGTALAVDSSGNTFLTGHTEGQFPTTPGSAIPSSTTAPTFAARLNSDGSTLLYVTYLPSTINTPPPSPSTPQTTPTSAPSGLVFGDGTRISDFLRSGQVRHYRGKINIRAHMTEYGQ
jgi:hypothetical protein